VTCGCAQIQRTSGLWYSAEYSTFSISDEAGKYQLSVSGYSGDAGDAIAVGMLGPHSADGMMFSTPDVDNDVWLGGNCASEVQNGRGWWFQHCSCNSLNHDDMAIWTISYAVYDVQASRMLVKHN